MSTVPEGIDLLQAGAETRSAAELVSFALQRFSPRIAIAPSFGAEDVALIQLAAQVCPDFRVFTLDTDPTLANRRHQVQRTASRPPTRASPPAKG